MVIHNWLDWECHNQIEILIPRLVNSIIMFQSTSSPLWELGYEV